MSRITVGSGGGGGGPDTNIANQGNWDASTNTPALASGVGTPGHLYEVSVAGATNLDGETDWQVGDAVLFDGTQWRKLDATPPVVSVAGKAGAVTLDHTDITDFDAEAAAVAPVQSVAGKAGAVTLVEADITNLGTYEPALTTMSQAEAEAGTSTAKRATTPQRQKQAIDALAIPAVRPTISNKVANYTVAAADEGKVLSGTGTVQFELPAGLTVGFQAVIFAVSGTVTLAAGGGATLTTKDAKLQITNDAAVTILCTAANTWRAFGTLQ